ncbi:MAG: rod shape-determining protein MreD [Candidatus Cloacimonadaceae bacterium]|jgi:rod shape-determining protein MreD|nr:rod shape-determining protein MreD [Candidatus Cloacimonadota bacterium]MDY0127586.1 rod shape-determining protein MreD [Candidatus Cloacimonadaceae bacterium]MCB5255778.1 rod shape-determining protein MreD [Candidatus Cloacimonadota bacterium]MCK9178471.1 rod shape-determining protein MreD [Candidatus Cloacimonadota bacterium]MCK9243429.1 rod shape-determining protein MreD [Candidatus Cloacimonadota bacterium]
MWIKALKAFLTGLLFLYIQILAMPVLAIGNVVPLILLPWLIATVWKHPQEISLPVVFLIGLMYDTQLPGTFGMHALLFCLLAVLINILRIPFEQDSIVAKLIAIASSNIVFALLSWLGYGLSWGFDGKLYWLSLAAFFYNLFFSLIIFTLMQLISRLRLVMIDE